MASKGFDDWGAGFDFNEESQSSDNFFGDSFPEKRRLSAGRIVWSVFLGVFFSALIAFIVYGLYRNNIAYPSQEVVDYTQTGAYCLDNWKVSIDNLESTGTESYLYKEIEYANGDEDKISFYKKMLGTVEYASLSVVARNLYGNDMIDPNTNELVYIDSYVGVGEEVSFSYIDYGAVDFTVYEDKIRELMGEHNLSYGDVDYENRLVGVFVDFMLWLPEEDIPIKIVNRVPYMNSTVDEAGIVSFYIEEEEDIYLDQLLLSSNEFYD